MDNSTKVNSFSGKREVKEERLERKENETKYGDKKPSIGDKNTDKNK